MSDLGHDIRALFQELGWPQPIKEARVLTDLVALTRGRAEEVWALFQNREWKQWYGDASWHHLLLDALAEDEVGRDVLQRWAVNDKRHWNWSIQMNAIQALSRQAGPELIPLFRPIASNLEEHESVRQAAIEALVKARDTGILELLRSFETSPETLSKFWMQLGLWGRASLGDLTATRAAIVWSFSQDQYWAKPSDEALMHLKDHAGGLEPLVCALWAHEPERLHLSGGDVAAQLDVLARFDDTPEVRLWATQQLRCLQPQRSTELLLRALGDASWVALRGASDALAALNPFPVRQLSDLVQHPGFPSLGRLWAARTLLLHGERPDLTALPESQIDLPVPTDIREAIVRYWVPHAEVGTDVRWLIERLMLPEEMPDVRHEHEHVRNALEEQGLEPGEMGSAGDIHGQGQGNYSSVQLGHGFLYVSDIARYASWMVWNEDEEAWGDGDPEYRVRIQRALVSVGWSLLPEAVGKEVIPGLNVYFFGRRKALPVQDLLFYWQD